MSGSRPIATCRRCRSPLICTLAFRKFEFICIDCGLKHGWLDPIPADETPELKERLAALQAEWDDHAGRKLLADCAWHDDCDKCDPDGEYHRAHASDAELRAHEEAIAWLTDRIQQRATA